MTPTSPASALFVALAATALPAMSATLVHYWDFEGGYADKAGSADGTAGAEVSTSTGWDGNTAAQFPGAVSGGGAFDSTGYVDITVGTPVAGAFTMSYWIKIADDGGTNARGIFDFSGDGGDGPQSLYIGGTGNLAFRVDGLSGGGAALAPLAEDDLWHFVVASYDPTNGIEVHIDGFGVDASNPSTYGTVNWDPDQYLGAFNVGTNVDRGLDGSLDDVAIYDGLLTESQINGLFNGTLSPDGIPEPGVTLLGALGLLGLLRRRR